MTPEQAREAAAVMLAWADGKKIECRDYDAENWRTVVIPSFAWGVNEYRVAPEPWQGRIWVHPAGDVRDESHFCGLSPKDEGYRLITAKEVADE